MGAYTDVSVIPYRDELIVELLGTDDHGAVDVVSYQFDYDSESRDVVVPRQSIDGEHISDVAAALEDEGYRMASSIF